MFYIKHVLCQACFEYISLSRSVLEKVSEDLDYSTNSAT